MTTNTHPSERKNSRKIAAVLAGGLVLGIGTMATLASWNDSEYASATFSSGTFRLQGSTDGVAFADHATSGDAASLTFTAPFDNLTPSDTIYAPYALRLTADTTNDATVAVTNPVTAGDASHLSYRLIQTDSFGCDAGSTGTELVATGPVGTASDAQTFELAKGEGGADGQAVNLCFVVTAGSDLAQDQAGSSTWQFTATSK
nr:SipW-dependent-type signal peptide-containing protein [Propionicimonas sp.]